MSWIRLSANEQARLSKSEETTVKGINITVTMSPYCVPIGVKGDYNKQRRVFEIRFKYLDEEAPRFVSDREGVTFLEGQNSGRILGLDIESDKLSIDAIRLAIQIIDEKEPKAKDQSRANWDAAKSILTNRGQDLALALAR